MTATLLHGDCLELMKTLPDKSIDLFLCDLPYGCLKVPRSKEWMEQYGRTESGSLGGCDWDVKINLEEFWTQVERLMKDDHTPILHFCSTKFGNDLINSKPSWFRYDLIWNKMRGISFLSANKMPMRSHELIYVFSKKGARYNRIDEVVDGKTAYKNTTLKQNSKNVYGMIENRLPREQPDGHRCVLSVIDVGVVGGSVYDCASEKRTNPIVRLPPREDGKRCAVSVIDSLGIVKKGKHPTQKPDDLYEWLIKRYSNEGDTILDPTAGSFSSVFTAVALGRNGIGMEMNDDFYNKANERASLLSGGSADVQIPTTE